MKKDNTFRIIFPLGVCIFPSSIRMKIINKLMLDECTLQSMIILISNGGDSLYIEIIFIDVEGYIGEERYKCSLPNKLIGEV